MERKDPMWTLGSPSAAALNANAKPTLAFGPRVRKSPYHEATLRHGATAFTVYNHMYLPMAYSEEPGRDYWGAVRGVQLWDVACERQVEVSGPDALPFAQRLTPRDLSRLQVGQAAYALVTNAEGGILNDPVVLRVAEDRFWFSLADGDILLWAQGLAAGGDCDVAVAEPDVSPLQVQGPHSAELLAGLLGDWVHALNFYRFREFDFDGIPLLVGRMGYSHERCFELFLRDGSRGEELWERLWEAGRPLGVTAGAPNLALRLEAGIHSHLSDTDAATNPFEVGLGWTVQLDTETPFIGQDALRNIAAKPLKRRLLGAEIEGPPLWAGNEHRLQVLADGQPAGCLTSCGYSPRLAKNLAFVMLSRPHAEPGRRIEVQFPDGRRPAETVNLPWMMRQR